MKEIKIATLMPTYSDIPPRAYRSHIRAILVAHKKGYKIEELGLTERELICHARNRLVEALLSSNCTHGMWIDSDIVLPHNAISALVEADQEICTGIYFQKVIPYKPLILIKGKFSFSKKEKGMHQFLVQWPENDIFPIDACGFGCVLIRREVFEKVKKPWFEFTEDSGEDIGFCIKAKKKGIGIYCHPGVSCGHVDGVEITGEDFRKQNIKADRQIRIGDGVFAEEEGKDNGSDLCDEHKEGSGIIL